MSGDGARFDFSTVQTLDKKTFEDDALSHSRALYRVALRMTRNPSEAEDLVQETLLRAVRARLQYQAGTNLKAWLLRIQTNAYINRYHRSGLERRTLDGATGDPTADQWMGSASLSAMRDPEASALRPALAREIQAALDAVPENFRVVVLLADVEELSYKEIAEVLDVPVGTVMSRLHRGRRLLKESLVHLAAELGIVHANPREGAASPSDVVAPVPDAVNLAEYRLRRRVG